MSTFEGWLLKVNGKDFPTSLIQYDSYDVTPDQETDQDDYTDADGIFHRNVLPAKATKIEFNTKPLFLADQEKIIKLIPNRVSLSVEFWNPWTAQYETDNFYVPDIKYHIINIDKKLNKLLYSATRIAFIGYGKIK